MGNIGIGEPIIENTTAQIPEIKAGEINGSVGLLKEQGDTSGSSIASFKKELSEAETAFDSQIKDPQLPDSASSQFGLEKPSIEIVKGVGYDSKEVKDGLAFTDIKDANFWIGLLKQKAKALS